MFQSAEHDVRNLVTGVGPDVDDLIVTLTVRDDAFAILLLDLADLSVSVLQLGLFFLRNNHVRNSDRNTGLGRFGKSELFQLVECRDRHGWACDLITTPDDITELLLARGFVEETQFLRPNLIEKNATCSRLDRAKVGIPVNRLVAAIRILESDAVVRLYRAIGHREFHFDGIREQRQRSLFLRPARVLRHVITAKRDVLRRRRDRFAARRRENVVRREHEHTRFKLCFDREWHVDGHLVAVEVRVVSGTDERVNADRFTFDQLRLESLDRQSVQRRRAVQQNGMSTRHFVENVPDLWRLALDHFLRAANRMDVAKILEPPNDERLEQDQRHFLRQTALMQFQFRTDDND